MTTAEEKKRIRSILTRLKKAYPEAECSLTHKSPLELLVSTILSAQCTDERVNMVTKDLFKKYRSAADYAQASQEEFEKDIQSTGFFRNKAKNIRECCRILADEYGGKVPDSMEALVALPGIGRKTANVVLGNAFDTAVGVVVDTHVGRLSRRLGLTEEKNAEKVEKDLMEKIPKKNWVLFSHQLIHHGRAVCKSRKPACDGCPLEAVCPKVGVE